MVTSKEASAVMWHDDSWGLSEWLSAGLLMLVMWTLLIAVVVLVVRSLGGQSAGGAAPDSSAGQPPQARRILDERFARGELSEEDYLRQRDLLSAR